MSTREGFAIFDWNAEDRQAFRGAAKTAWERAATEPEGATMVCAAQQECQRKIGLLDEE
ncbi:MAG: hypothetical protein NXH97_13315 [Rhodobacteraceae bacterium]|nr:hypothetical protein [Paracoccaceae bacterium]